MTRLFSKTFIEILNNLNAEYIILGGDFHFVQNSELDKIGRNNSTFKNSREVLNKYLQNENLIDIWRVRHPKEKKFTWQRRNPEIFCRLDYFFIPLNKSSEAHNVNILPAILTDHSLITVSIKFHSDNRGPGFWKLNCSLLNDIDYVTTVKAIINTTIEESKKEKYSSTLTWELIKFNVKTGTIKYSSEKQKSNNSWQKYLEEKLQNLKDALPLYNSEQEKDRIREEIQVTENDLNKLLEKQTKAAMIRSKSKFYENGEKNTKYFLGMEKRNQVNKYVKLLVNEKGDEISSRKEILEEEVNFYSKLYETRKSFENCPQSIKDSFFHIDESVQRLTEEEQLTCEGNITTTECENVLKTMKNNKSPGIDGIPFEFYKMFWLDIKEIFINCLEENYRNGKMTSSQRQNIISLLPKGNKDIRFLKNWRPISLLNCDYKIATKVLAYRIRKHLPKIISHDQTGFVKNRYIGENIRTIIDLIDYVEENDIPGFIFSVDFEKAFDSVDWDYLNESLRVFGFGEGLIKWLKVFYNDISSRTVNNGWASPMFTISRGLRQGCPLSPYLYVICAEILAIKLRHTENVEGIVIFDKTFLLSQFADDTQMFLKGTNISLNAALIILEKFEKLSGLKINFEKSECFKIGSLRNNRQIINTIRTIKWSIGPINVLGIKIPINNRKDIYKLNLEDKINSIQKTIKLWLNRKLTLVGKINILKSQVLSKLTYVMAVLPNLPQHYIEEIQTLFFNFIWDFKRDKIKRSTQINTIKNGGLSVPDLKTYEKSLKVSWIKRFLDDSTSQWKVFFEQSLKPFGGKLLFNCDMLEGDKRLDDISNPFYKDIIRNWFALNSTINQDYTTKIGTKILWNNKSIKINKKTLCYLTWIEKGIICISDLYYNQNILGFNDFINKYGIRTDFLTYYGICAAVPPEWKIKMSTEKLVAPYNIYTENFYHLLNKSKPNRFFYWKLLNEKSTFPVNILNKWKGSFPNIGKHDLQTAFVIPYKVSVETKIRNFQFKFIHRILPNNSLLFKMGKVDSNFCKFCKIEIDNLDHMFWNCRVVKQFLEEIRLYLESKLGIGFVLKKDEYFLGILGKSDYILLNHIYILLKFYIFRCFVSTSMPFAFAFKNYIYSVEECERNIAKINGLLKLHSVKWNPLFIN